MAKGLVTLFGGSGFIGQYAARALVEQGFRVRVAVRRPHLAGDVRLAGAPGWVDIVQANVYPAEVLVVPRVLALLFLLPILGMIANFSGLIGGMLMSWIEKSGS